VGHSACASGKLFVYNVHVIRRFVQSVDMFKARLGGYW